MPAPLVRSHARGGCEEMHCVAGGAAARCRHSLPCSPAHRRAVCHPCAPLPLRRCRSSPPSTSPTTATSSTGPSSVRELPVRCLTCTDLALRLPSDPSSHHQLLLSPPSHCTAAPCRDARPEARHGHGGRDRVHLRPQEQRDAEPHGGAHGLHALGQPGLLPAAGQPRPQGGSGPSRRCRRDGLPLFP